MKTRAVKDGDHYVINGTKRFITGAGGLCSSHRGDRSAEGCARRRNCFIVDMKAPGVTLERLWPTMMGDTPGQILFEMRECRRPI